MKQQQQQQQQRDAGASVPLLPEVAVQSDGVGISEGASMYSAIFNVSTSMVGAGIMSIPATFKVLGIIPSFAVILIVAFFVEVTVEFLLKYTRHTGELDSYGALMAESFGKPGAVALQVCVLVTNLGAMIIYLIIIGDVLSGNCSGGSIHLGVLQEWFGTHWWNSRAYALLFVVLFIMLPLVILRRIDSLRYASAASILLAVLFVVLCSGMAIQAMWEGKTQKARLVPDFAHGMSFFDLFTTIPVIATAFGCHVNVHPIRAELGRPSQMSLAVRISLVLCIAIYFAVGFFGYVLFGDSIMADMLVNFDAVSDSVIGKLLNDTIRLSYAIHLMLVFPVMNFSLRANVDELLFSKRPLLATDSIRFLSLTCVLLAFTYVAAVAIPNIWYFFQFMGTTTVVCLMFIFPSSLILRDVHCISTCRDRILATLVIVLAAGTSLIAISSNIYNYFGKK
ncbi:amino acid transporter AVT6C isoform X1 [Coffea arabica]|uniref:Amino acid transporter AVT6C-like isoform X1 n=1 Tax=Coffea arabica TaxID=13443 RepID=A0A6P6VNZ0_COFAR|nr:amino acid transporter AVT6C-like isoform X1 [Coffea arabica]XP_027104229.1 amino acid transporter AVT6C-like isoform X1 [Coffea arabica]XP_027104230.1 amino acid transporter AVT6C-like isoform X1 [Coffea arabica]